VRELTQRQIESRQTKIKRCKAALSAEKRKFGWHDDSRGLRYLIPELYIEIKDYKGALRYFRWFQKSFPDDGGFPGFFLSWTKALFEDGKLLDAKRMAIKTALTNIYLIPILLDLPVEEQDLPEYASVDSYAYAADSREHFLYLVTLEFSDWLNEAYTSKEYQVTIEKYVLLSQKLETLPASPERTAVVEKMYALPDSLESIVKP